MPQTPATSFDDDLKAVQSDFESDLKAVQDHVSAGTPVPHPLVAKILDWLPTVGGAVGGMVGGVPGAAVGGAAGQGLKTTAEHVTEIPGAVADVARNLVTHPSETVMGGLSGMREGAQDAAVEGAKQGAMEGVGRALTAVAKPAGEKLMTSALKPAYALTEKAVRKAELPRVVKTMLDEGVNVTQAGIGKINTLLKATNDEIKSLIANSTATISPAQVARTAAPVIREAGNQVAGAADQAAARGVVKEFVAKKGMSQGAMRQMPVQEAQALKQGTYKAMGQRAYGETKGAALEAEKALARGLKEGIEQAHPEVKGLNAREGALIEARNAIAKRVAQAANRDPGGLAWLAANPGQLVAFAMSRNPAVKSMLARGLYQSAEKASGVPQNLIRLAMQAMAAESSDEAQP